jgi:uncharacterized Tic20 family protein
MNLSDELQKLQQLHEAGTLSDEEFAAAKERLLSAPTPTFGIHMGDPMDNEQQTRLWAMILHFSQFAGYIVPVAGLVVPIIIWQFKKTDLPGIDAHGKIVVNWLLSAMIYALGCFLLLFVFIGMPFLIALGIIAVIFPIIGGIKANNGEAWKYPLSISFFS